VTTDARAWAIDVAVPRPIDTRFFPQPERTRVALYPPWFVPPGWSSAEASDAALAALIARHYEVAPAQVMLTSSGAAALAVLCGWLQAREPATAPLRVAMPAFCCPSVCEAILAAGATPVFLDVGADLGLTEASVEFAARAGCRVVLWPQLFGARDLDDAAVRLCARRGLWLVSDEAQSFPGPVHPSAGATLARIFSFGPAKLLAGLGGGGLCIPDPDHATELAAYVARSASASASAVPGEHRAAAVVQHVRHAVVQAFVTGSRTRRRVAERLGLARPLRPDLRALLDATGVRPVVVARMAPLARSAAAWLVRNRQTLVARVRERAESIAATITAAAGPAALAFLDGVRGAPSVYALSVAPERRHALGAALAAHGIQTTWFYFPLNRLAHLAAFPSEATPNADRLAARTLIVPLRWHHATREITVLRRALGRVLTAEPSHPGAAS
jgi:dTDP-4-amino-4,6-dideoxygalactose transaminase